MAQYYQVLSQAENPGESFYANSETNQTVQYVISHGGDQQFVSQPQIVMASDQVMVIEGQPQQVIQMNQNQIAYQTQPAQQFVEQDGAQGFQNRQPTTQRVFYMESSPNNSQDIAVIDGQAVQPVVLNHQIGAGPPPLVQQKPVVRPQMMNSGIRQPIKALPTSRQPIRNANQVVRTPQQLVRLPTSVRSTLLNQQFAKNVQPTIQTIQNLQEAQPAKVSPVEYKPQDVKVDEIAEKDQHEAISLPDGSVVSVADYKKILLNKKANEQKASLLTSPKKKPTRSRATKAQSKPKASLDGATGGRGCRGGATHRSKKNTFNETFPPTSEANMPSPPLGRLTNQSTYPPQQQQAQSTVRPQFAQRQQFCPNQHLQRQPQQQNQPRQTQNQYIIQPPHLAPPKTSQSKPLPSYIPSSQIQQIIENTPVGEEYSDSIRMLVLLANGEQRLITFTLPKEACTIQEILEQVGVPLQPDTNVEVNEANINGLNYIVTVGNLSQVYPDINKDEEVIEPETPQRKVSTKPCATSTPITTSAPTTSAPIAATTPAATPPHVSDQGVPAIEEPKRSPSPEPPKEVPKYIPGKLAVCKYCGYLSEDFNKCLRCRRKLPEGVKSITATITNNKKDFKTLFAEKSSSNPKPEGSKESPLKKRSKPKVVDTEPVILTLSSDDEDEALKAKKSLKPIGSDLLQKLGSSVTLSPIRKEPSLNDLKKKCPEAKDEADKSSNTNSASIHCRTVRIGSYKCVPKEFVYADAQVLIIKVPHPKETKEIITIKVDRSDIVKVLVSFNKQLPVLFYYLRPYIGGEIRNLLGMTKETDTYFDPLSESEPQRRITLLPEKLDEPSRDILKQVYTQGPHSILDELTVKEANDILIKTCPKELVPTTLSGIGNSADVKHILTYPPEGRGRISINTEDYLCLATDQFLNDVIIDFYLKYLVHNLSLEEQEKVHVFSTFFYKRLTTKPLKASRKIQPTETDPNLTQSEKRHARVKTWTKNTNLFEKDFIIVPINENCHWFLAIICFPGLEGCQTIEGGQPIKIEVQQRSKKKTSTMIGNVTITSIKQEKAEKPITCDDPEASDKDEAEGDESELESDDSDETGSGTTSVISSRDPDRPPIKQPCILIFDSLAGTSRSRVVATLRDYLTCEYKAKMKTEKTFTKDLIKGACPKVPQQTNFTDCGLYLLQYVEHFFMDPIKDYYIPINHLKTWFDELTVTRKREDISILIKDLMLEYDKDLSILPHIALPTKNGVPIEHAMDEEDDELEDEDDEDMNEEEFSQPNENEMTNESSELSQQHEENSSIKATDQDVTSKASVPVEANVIKTDLSEILPRQSCRETLSYLKAKRIIKNKNTEGPEVKKQKSSE